MTYVLITPINQMSSKLLLLSGFLLLSGYFWGMISHPPKPVSEEFVRFRRKEQTRWLKDYYRKALAPLQ
ncbi:MAG: hypothetical protein ABSG73_06785 [Candidatus Aminicenantales bacterium]|jgi:hypothetical protein